MYPNAWRSRTCGRAVTFAVAATLAAALMTFSVWTLALPKHTWSTQTLHQHSHVSSQCLNIMNHTKDSLKNFEDQTGDIGSVFPFDSSCNLLEIPKIRASERPNGVWEDAKWQNCWMVKQKNTSVPRSWAASGWENKISGEESPSAFAPMFPSFITSAGSGTDSRSWPGTGRVTSLAKWLSQSKSLQPGAKLLIISTTSTLCPPYYAHIQAVHVHLSGTWHDPHGATTCNGPKLSHLAFKKEDNI